PARLSALPAPLPNVERLTADAVPPAQIANRENARLIVPKQRDTLFHRTGLLERHRPTSSNRATTLTCQESTRSKLSGLSPVCTTGDGFLIEFPSVVGAVRCAVEVQHRMVERNAEVPEEKRMEFRVGINLGDVIVEDDDVHGDGVNVAARLESIAEPGGIARNSSFTYKGRAVDVRQVGRELGVRYVLEGSIRRAIDRVR